MVQAGVDLVRVNFSHGDLIYHQRRIKAVRQCAEEMGRHVGILADMQGPKVRVARFQNGRVMLEAGQRFILDPCHLPDEGNARQVGVDYPELASDVRPGQTLLLDDGKIVLFVEEVRGNQIVTSVRTGGELSNHKGINLQGGGLSVSALTTKDLQDMQHIAALAVDYVAISFVRSGADILEARRLLREAGSGAGIIAKIERVEAVAEIAAIIAASDGVMVARGDLAVEIGDAEVPAIQKQIIQLARTMNKPVITATQMMESMIKSPTPTRAEVSDVANAVLDLSDAVMLSAETAVGAHPATVIETMARICLTVEKQPATQISRHRLERRFERVDEITAMAAMYAANHMDIKAVASVSASGSTPLWMSRIRTGIPIYGLSCRPEALGLMTLYRSVNPVFFATENMPRHEVETLVVAELVQRGFVQRDDLVIITLGDLAGEHGGTNSMKIVRV
jgi:pyruvate kinase